MYTLKIYHDVKIEENKQDEEPVECARQLLDSSSNDLELIAEADALEIPETSLKSENMVSKRASS